MPRRIWTASLQLSSWPWSAPQMRSDWDAQIPTIKCALPVSGDAQVLHAFRQLAIECGDRVVSVCQGNGCERGIGQGRELIRPDFHDHFPWTVVDELYAREGDDGADQRCQPLAGISILALQDVRDFEEDELRNDCRDLAC